jgi:hypothetical protein
MRIFLLIPFVLFAGTGAPAAGFNHSGYDSLLQQYVTDGRVDYQGLKTDRQSLQNYLISLSEVDPEAFQGWPRDEQKAFWINSYNAITIEGILRHYPIQYGSLVSRARFAQNSIRQIDDFWKKVFIPVMGQNLTLDDIEHQILRQEFDDPRIHFVLVCAAVGCPLLSSRAYRADNLDSQLDQAALDFITNPDKVRLDRDRNVLYLSAILDWYHGDFKPGDQAARYKKGFDKKYRGVVEFVAGYMSEVDLEYLHREHPAIKFLDYDWTLNEKAEN